MALDAPTPDAAVDPVARSRERAPAWVWLLGLAVGGVHLLPHLGAPLVEQPPERVYVGFAHMVPDHASYLGFAEQARATLRWPLRDPYTTEAQDGRFPMAYFWVVGALARLLGVEVLTAWYALLPLCSLLLLLAIWRLSGFCFASPGWRRLAVLISSLGGGFGWLATLVWPALTRHEAVALSWNWSVLGAALHPMWTLAHALLVQAICVLLRGAEGGAAARPGRRGLRLVAVPALVLASYLVHPYTGMGSLALLAAIATALVFEAATQLRQRILLDSAVQLLTSALLLAGLALWARADATYRATSANVFSWTDHFSPLWYPLLYGAPLVLALLGALRARTVDGTRRSGMLIAWCTTAAVLANLWFVPGVKFQYLVFLPLALLATQGLQVLVVRWPGLVQGRRRTVTALVLGLCIAGGPLPDALREFVPRPDARIFVSQPQLELLAALRALPDGGVLAPPSVAILVPWKGGKPVYDGHWFLSPQHEARLDEVRRFYQPHTPDVWRLELLQRGQIRYLLEDPWTAGRLADRLGPRALVERYRNTFGRILELMPSSQPAAEAP